MTTSVPPLWTLRLLGRIAAVIVLQALAVGVIIGGMLYVTRAQHHDGLDALPPLIILLLSTQLGLIVGVAVTGVRALRAGRTDVAAGWLIGLVVVVVIPFALVLLQTHGVHVF